MPFLRNSSRKIRSATEVGIISRVLEKYVNIGELYRRSEFNALPVELLEHPSDNQLVLRFNEPVDGESVSIFTIVNGRFIDFECDSISPAGNDFSAHSYRVRIARCSIALEKRTHERIGFRENRPAAVGLSTVKVRERQRDFLDSLSVKMIVEEFIQKIEGVDYKRVSFPFEKDLSPPVRYVIETGNMMHIEDISNPLSFFAANESLFGKDGFETPGEELRRWLQNNATSMHSIFVRPVTYRPIVGEPFPVGYLTLINKERSIDANRIKAVDAFIEDLSEKIRNGNLIESSADAAIIDVSPGGAKIELTDTGLMDRLVKQNVIIFKMSFKENDPLLISGSPAYVYRRNDGECFIGVDFRGSRFGPGIASVIPLHVKHFFSLAGKSRVGD